MVPHTVSWLYVQHSYLCSRILLLDFTKDHYIHARRVGIIRLASRYADGLLWPNSVVDYKYIIIT